MPLIGSGRSVVGLSTANVIDSCGVTTNRTGMFSVKLTGNGARQALAVPVTVKCGVPMPLSSVAVEIAISKSLQVDRPAHFLVTEPRLVTIRSTNAWACDKSAITTALMVASCSVVSTFMHPVATACEGSPAPMLRLVLSGPILKYPKGHWACAVEEIIVAIKAKTIILKPIIWSPSALAILSCPQKFRFKNPHNPRNEGIRYPLTIVECDIMTTSRESAPKPC